MTSELEDKLVKLAQQGDQKAFQELVVRYQRRVFNICYGIVKNADEAQDLTQETFIRVHKNLARFEGNASFYTWIYRIAKNVGIDHIRKSRRRSASSFDEMMETNTERTIDTGSMPTPLGINPSKVAGRRELMEQMQNALASLSESHREIIVLREIEDLSYQEIADALDISIGTVMSRLHHARKNMQKALHDYVGNDFRATSDEEG